MYASAFPLIKWHRLESPLLRLLHHQRPPRARQLPVEKAKKGKEAKAWQATARRELKQATQSQCGGRGTQPGQDSGHCGRRGAGPRDAIVTPSPSAAPALPSGEASPSLPQPAACPPSRRPPSLGPSCLFLKSTRSVRIRRARAQPARDVARVARSAQCPIVHSSALAQLSPTPSRVLAEDVLMPIIRSAPALPSSPRSPSTILPERRKNPA